MYHKPRKREISVIVFTLILTICIAYICSRIIYEYMYTRMYAVLIRMEKPLVSQREVSPSLSRRLKCLRYYWHQFYICFFLSFLMCVHNKIFGINFFLLGM